MATGAVLAVTAIAAGSTAVAAQRQGEASRRAETRAKALAGEESRRQKKQESLIAAQEAKTQKAVAGRLRATAGKRAGRRSLIFDSATGVDPAASQLGTQETLG